VTALRLVLPKWACVAQLRRMLSSLCGVLRDADTAVVALEQSRSAGVIPLRLAHHQPQREPDQTMALAHNGYSVVNRRLTVTVGEQGRV